MQVLYQPILVYAAFFALFQGGVQPLKQRDYVCSIFYLHDLHFFGV